MFPRRIFRYKQHENQRNRFAVGRIESYRLFGTDKRPHRFFHGSMAPVRNRHALPQPRRTQLFAGKQAVEHIGTRQPGFIFKQQTDLLENTFFAANIQIQNDMGYR